MEASPMLRTRLIRDDESQDHEVSPDDYCTSIACMDCLTFMGIEVRRPKFLDSTDTDGREPPCGSFGRPITELCAEGVDTIWGRVPRIVFRIVTLLDNETMLKTEFIFRVSGALVRMNNSKPLLEQDSSVQLPPHDLAGLLKMFLRQMPQGLMNSAYNTFIAVARLEDAPQRTRALQLACGLLSRCNRETLKYLMAFFSKVTTHSASNKMDAHNLALLLAPNLLYCSGKQSKQLDDARLAQEKLAVEIVEALILQPDLIGTLPADVTHIANTMDQDEARKRYMAHNCPRKRRSSIQKMLRIVGDAGSTVRNAFAGRGHTHSAAISMPTADLSKVSSPLAITPVATRVHRTISANMAKKDKSPTLDFSRNFSADSQGVIAQANGAVKRKAAPEPISIVRTPVANKLRAVVSAAAPLQDPRARGKENPPPIKDQKEVFESSSESPSKRFRTAANMAAKKEAELLENAAVGLETPLNVVRRSERRKSMGASTVSPPQRMAVDASPSDAETFMAVDGQRDALFGFSTTPLIKRQQTWTPADAIQKPVTPRVAKHSPMIGRTPSKLSPSDANVSDCSWV